MPKRSACSRRAFTLIEVMVAVMIISLVIAALLEMRSNATHRFFNIQKTIQTNQYSSFLLANSEKYGFERSRIDMKRLVDDFDLESDLRRKLSSIKVEVDYEELSIIDTSEYEDGEENSNAGVIFEIGKSILKTEEFTLSLTRVRLQ